MQSRECRLINDVDCLAVLAPSQPSSCLYYIYVDNIGFISIERDLVAELLCLCEEAFGRRQLVLHETGLGDVVEALGTVLDGRAHQTRITTKRFWRLRGALTRILTVRRCSGRVLEVIIGHCTFVGLLARESLAVVHTVYAFHPQVLHEHWLPVAKRLGRAPCFQRPIDRHRIPLARQVGFIGCGHGRF